MGKRIQGAVAIAVLLACGGRVRAEAPPASGDDGAPGAVAPPAADAPELPEAPATLVDADEAVDAGDLKRARSLYQRVASEQPDTPDGAEARRALKILDAGARARAGTAPPQADEAPVSDDVVVRREPYSMKTKERLRLSAWEKLDFGTTAFLYGMSVGYSYALSLDNVSDGLPVVAIGALGYTLGAVLFLNVANPDRGDLPLALGITSYVPTTTLLIANVGFEHASGRSVATATTFAGVLSVPVAVYAAHELDLDPGDAQLVRDAGFWGLVLGTTGMLGFGGSPTDPWGYQRGPSSRAVAAAGLVGLYGGLGLGALTAHFQDISLERVRISTWGGYGGAVVGLLLAAAGRAGNEGAYQALFAGALSGLVLTFAATGSLDGIPADDPPSPRATSLRLTPTLAPSVGVDGQTRAMLGLSGVLF